MTIALPVSARLTPLSDERDLARRAGRGHRDAFDELYRRHSQPAWRLAAAVAAGRSEAVDAVGDGFARALRGARRLRSGDDALRPQVLAGVYRSVLDAAAMGTAPTTRSAPAGESLVVTSFLSLPERWRAAVWLHEVEGYEAPEIATVIGTTPTVAGHLADRGRLALAGRLAQAGQTLPAAIGTALRPLAAAVPTGLAEVSIVRWRRDVVVDPSTRLAPLTSWIGPRAPRTLGLAAAGLLALGLVGLGVLTQTTNAAGVAVVATGGVPGANGSLTGPSLATGAHGGPGSAILSVAPIVGLPADSLLAVVDRALDPRAVTRAVSGTRPVTTGIGRDGSTGSAPGTGTKAHGGSGTTTSGGGGGKGGGSGTGGGGTGGGGTGGGGTGGGGSSGGGGGTGGGGTGGGGTPVVDVPGVADVSTGSGGISVTVGSGTAPVAQVDTCTDGVEVNLLGVVVGSCPDPSGGGSGSGSSGSGTGGSGGSGSGGSGSGGTGSGASGSGGSGGGSGLGGILGDLGVGSGGSGSGGTGGTGSGGTGSGGTGSGGSGSGGTGSGSGGSGSAGSGSGSGLGGILGGLGL